MGGGGAKVSSFQGSTGIKSAGACASAAIDMILFTMISVMRALGCLWLEPTRISTVRAPTSSMINRRLLWQMTG